MKIKFLLIGTSLSLIPTLTFAQCVATQDCETLGYTETSCNGGKGVKCPFGNKWACLTSEEECLNLACDKLGFSYTCTGTGETGVGNNCNGKYQACTCASGYEWNGSNCQIVYKGEAHGDFYYCNGTLVGVKASSMNFYVALKDLGQMDWFNANNQISSYAFCGNIKGTLPTKDQLLTIYNNKSSVNYALWANGGTELAEDWYWSSTAYSSDYYYDVHMSGGVVGRGYIYGNKGTYVRPVLTSW